MTMSGTKIAALELENLKRVKVVSFTIGADKALTVIGGRNKQGKSTVLDGIMWILGGDRYRPSNPQHAGSKEPPYGKVTLDNGIVAERGGKNGDLKVTSTRGKGGQALLNEFISTFALDLPKFTNATATDKTKMLLDVFPGLGVKLVALNSRAKALYEERTVTGQMADRKAKFAAELPFDFEAPETPLSGAEMTKRLQDAITANASNAALRADIPRAEEQLKAKLYRTESVQKRVDDLSRQLSQARLDLLAAEQDVTKTRADIDHAKASAQDLRDVDTTSLEAELEHIDALNARTRANESKRVAEDEASRLKNDYARLTDELEAVRAERIKLLAGVQMPLDGLSIDEEGRLVYRQQPWDGMSSAEQLQVATAICSAINPKCGFVLLDKLEAMDPDTLIEFDAWLKTKDLQAIGTRVSTGQECSIIIEDGEVVEKTEKAKEYKF
jgi:hypothetical protein